MTSELVIWHGRDAALARLHAAVERHCTCVMGESTCPPHAMLGDQSVLDHMAFVFGNRRIYVLAEGAPADWPTA